MKINNYNDWSEIRFEIEFGIVPESWLLLKFLIWFEKYEKYIIQKQKVIQNNRLNNNMFTIQ